MTDIVTRLRRWTISTDAVPASDLMDEAADEIVALRAGVLRWQCEVSVMLRERAKSYEKSYENRSFSDTNLDAVPAATAPNREASPLRPSAGVTAGEGTGKQTAPPCVESDTPPSGSSGGPINRSAERQPPASDWRESQPLDDTRPDTKGEATGGRGHHILDAEIDALEYVAAMGVVASLDRPHISSLLERLRPIAKRENDSPQPVAWIAFATDGSESSAVYMTQEQAQAAADEWGWSIAPLYATQQTHATPSDGSVQGGCSLTDEEREAVESCIADDDAATAYKRADILRSLLERLK